MSTTQTIGTVGDAMGRPADPISIVERVLFAAVAIIAIIGAPTVAGLIYADAVAPAALAATTVPWQ